MSNSWRGYVLPNLFRQHNIFSQEDIKSMDMYQFGVLDGDSMKELSKMFCTLEFPINSFYGFDVFTGMPKENAEPIFQEAWDPDLMPDAFNAVKRLNLNSPEEVASYIQRQVQKIYDQNNYPTTISVVPGLVEETMQNIGNYRKAFYVDFDLDIYSPTKYAFDYLAKNGLIVKGTFIGYDDWGGTPHKNFEHGESRAHKEVSDEYGIKMTKIYEGGQGDPHLQTVWIVDEV
jgi:hypothetical protein